MASRKSVTMAMPSKGPRKSIARMTKMGVGKAGDDVPGHDELGKPIDPSKVFIKPDDQVELSEAELKQEHTRILTAKNPHAPDNLITFDFHAMAFKEGPAIQHLEVNYRQTGTLMHEETDEAQQQIRDAAELEAELKPSVTSNASQGSVPPSVANSRMTTSVAGSVAGSKNALSQVDIEGSKKKEKLVKNQFNFQDRGSQSAVQPPRSKLIQTDPPPRVDICSSVSQWEIYDFYQRHLQAIQAEKDKANTKQSSKQDSKKKNKKTDEPDKKICDVSSMTAKKVDRMLNQNTYDQLADDFKYFNDPMDGPDKQEGSLLPLWRFDYEKTKRLAVTSMAWCPGTENDDLIVVSYGSFDFYKQGKGFLIYYSLKNPSFPEFVVPSPYGIMCLAVHEDKGFLTACGLYDGSVAIFNAKESLSGPIFMTSETNRHTEPVWSVKWLDLDEEGRFRFCSISTDGQVKMWTLVKNDLVGCTLLELTSLGSNGLGSGISIDFHPLDKKIYLCGTEEGELYKCTTTYSSKYLSVVKAHDGAIMGIKWNKFHPDVYATCGQDWALKVWSQKRPEIPLFNFELGASVNDLDWAPYSSTVICGVTEGDNSRAYLYDLNINKYEPLCDQGVSLKKKTRLTQVKFNPQHKILMVGNDRGTVSAFKLSPNLRKVPVKSKKDPTPLPMDPQKEYEKFNKVVNNMIDD